MQECSVHVSPDGPDLMVSIQLLSKYYTCGKALVGALKSGHPYMPKVLGIDEGTDYFYLNMCYPSEYRLAQWIKNQRNRQKTTGTNSSERETTALKYFCCILKALEHLHQHRILHRNVTPNSIYLTKDGKDVQLCDFTTFKLLETREETRDTHRGFDPGYVPPEMWDDIEPSQGLKGDIWCLGCVLYEMLMPFHPYDKTNPICVAMAVATANQGKPVAFPDHVTCSNSIKELITHMLDPDPSTRWSLEQILQQPFLQPYLTDSS